MSGLEKRPPTASKEIERATKRLQLCQSLTTPSRAGLDRLTTRPLRIPRRADLPSGRPARTTVDQAPGYAGQRRSGVHHKQLRGA